MKLEREKIFQEQTYRIEKRQKQIEKSKLDLKKDLKDRTMQMTQRREERLIRMHREQRDHDRKLNLEYNDLMKSYAEQAKNWTLHEA